MAEPIEGVGRRLEVHVEESRPASAVNMIS
jgi:hypothetical protein